jgi:hypothetical protein
MNANLPTEAQCKRANTLFDDILEPVYRYAERKRLPLRAIAGYHEVHELWEGYPEEWEESVLGMLVAGAVCTRPDRVAAFLRSQKATLSDQLVAMVRAWRARPWAWSCFSVMEDLGDRRLRIAPVGAPPSTWTDKDAWSEMLLYSRAVTDNYKRGSNLFFTLLVDLGPAFVTYGAIVPLGSLERADVLFLADVVQHADDLPGSVPLIGIVDPAMLVSDIAARDPFPFLALMRFSETPPVRTPQGVPGKYASWASLPDTAGPWSEDTWREAAEASGEHLSAITFDDTGGGISYGEGSVMYDPAIYLSRETERAFLEARTRAAYDRGRAAAARIVDFPVTPEVEAGMLVVAASAKFVGFDETLLDECGVLRQRYEDDLSTTEPPEVPFGGQNPESLPSGIEEAQAIIDRLTYNHNEGIREDTDAIAEDLGIDPAIVDNIRTQLEASLSRMEARMGDTPSADRFGLSPRAFTHLIRGGVPNVPGAIRLREAAELQDAQGIMESAPYQRGVQWLLDRAMSEDGLPATQAGYIAPSVVARAYEDGLMTSVSDDDAESRDGVDAAPRAESHERYRPRKESDWFSLLRLRSLAESAHLLRLSGKAFEPTETAHRLADDPVALYRHLLATALQTYDWARGGMLEPPPQLHQLAGFLFYAAGELCDARRTGAAGAEADDSSWVPVSMLADRFIGALPPLAERVRAEPSVGGDVHRRPFAVADWVRAIVQTIFVNSLGVDFGLFELNDEHGDDAQFRTTPLYDALFERG